MAFCCLKLPKSFSYVIDGATWWSADIIFELRMFYNIELSSFPGSMASNWELVKINLAPIDLLASPQVKRDECSNRHDDIGVYICCS